MPDQSRIALCRGPERAANLRRAVELVIDDIDWINRGNVVIKPNLVAPNRSHAITHPDALAAVLEAIRMRYDGPLTIAEGCALDPTIEAFAHQGYGELAAFYGARVLDLNSDEIVPVTVYNRRARGLRLRLAQQVVESDCRISLSLPKTHDAVLVTLSIKNMIMGSLVNRRVGGGNARPGWLDRLGQILGGHGDGWGSDKAAVHQGYPIININLALLAPLVWPHLSVLDGFVAMEGAGPTDGIPVPWRIAIAGIDPLAVDLFAVRLMGFDPNEIGYLNYCAKLELGRAAEEHVDVLGNVAPEKVARSFLTHPRHQEQRRWQRSDAAELLQRNVLTELA